MLKVNLLLCRLAVVMTCFAVSPVFAHAKVESIRCNLTATVIGDSHYFWAYGRDSWTGIGSVFCGIKIYPVRVTYSSWGTGIGAGSNSILSLSINALRSADFDSIVGSFRTYRQDVNAMNWDGSLTLNVEAASTIWQMILRSVGKDFFDMSSTIYFGQLTIQALPEDK